MRPLWQLSAREIARDVRAGALHAEAVVEACLERLRATEPVLHAYLQVLAEPARERARSIDQRRRRGDALGPLAGVPVAIKDNLHLEGLPVTCASRVLEGYVAPYTATAVQRLLDADAVILGKTNLDEFAMGSSCENSAYGPTRNPWDTARVPGGSSGGSAAAVASASVPLALGSDTGGSIRQPAALCGVVGCKPSYGRVSRYGLVAFASSLDQIGPMAREVADAALAVEVMAGEDPRDATSAAEPVPDLVGAALGGALGDLAGLRVGVVREVEAGALAPDVARVFRASIDVLLAAGASVVEVSIPNLPAAIAVYYVLANSEASANLARFDGVRYGRRAGAGDLLSTYLESRSQGFGAEVKRRIMLGTFALSSGYYDAYYGRARGVLRAMADQYAEALGRVDVLITPTSPSPAFRLGERTDDPLTMYLSDIFTVPANLLGAPGIAVPAGFDGDGLPLSLQVLGRRFDEATMFRVAAAFEARARVPTMAPLESPA